MIDWRKTIENETIIETTKLDSFFDKYKRITVQNHKKFVACVSEV